MTTYFVEAQVTIEVDINDENVVTRCVENHDDAGVPQSDERGSGGWRNVFYDLRTRDGVIEHLAYNFGINNARISQLDGWADLSDGAANGRITDIEYLSVTEVAST